MSCMSLPFQLNSVGSMSVAKLLDERALVLASASAMLPDQPTGMTIVAVAPAAMVPVSVAPPATRVGLPELLTTDVLSATGMLLTTVTVPCVSRFWFAARGGTGRGVICGRGAGAAAARAVSVRRRREDVVECILV